MTETGLTTNSNLERVRLISTLSHLSVFLGYLFPFLNFVALAIAYNIYQDSRVRRNVIAAANAQLSFMAIGFISIMAALAGYAALAVVDKSDSQLFMVLTGVNLLIMALVVGVVLFYIIEAIRNAIRVSKDLEPDYKFAYRFIKN